MKRRLTDPTGGELERLRKAYVDHDVPVREIGRRFRIDANRLTSLARRHGWPLRRAAVTQIAAKRQALTGGLL